MYVLAVHQPASCQCLALNPKAEPNYRRMATDLAGMLTKTEEAAGRGSLGKVTLDGCFTRADHRNKGGGMGLGGILYFRIRCSCYLS